MSFLHYTLFLLYSALLCGATFEDSNLDLELRLAPPGISNSNQEPESTILNTELTSVPASHDQIEATRVIQNLRRIRGRPKKYSVSVEKRIS
jgi:hypothetical protein